MTTPSMSGFKTAMGAVIDAIEAEDWALAAKEVAKAQGHLVGMPVSHANEGTVTQMRTDLKAMKDVIDAAESRSSAAFYELESRWNL